MNGTETQNGKSTTPAGAVALSVGAFRASHPIEISKIEVDDKQNIRQGSGQDKESLMELAKSMEQNQLWEPIIIRPTVKGFKVVAGYRRLAAAKMLGWKTIAAVVADATMDDKEAAITNYVENVHRHDIGTFEMARALANLRELGVPQNELIKRLHINKSQTTVDNLLRVFTTLDPDLKAAWGDPKSKDRPYLSMANLFAIVKYPITAEGEAMTQRKKFESLKGEVNEEAIQAALAKSERLSAGGGRAGVAGSAGGAAKKGTGNTYRFKKSVIDAAWEAFEKFQSGNLKEGEVMAYTAMFDFIRGGKTLKATDGKTVIFRVAAKVSKKDKKEASAAVKAKASKK